MRVVVETEGRAFDSARAETGRREDSRRELGRLRLEGPVVVRADARRVTGEAPGCWDRWETGVDSAWVAPVARGCRLGTAGRPGTERLMRLPCRMCPLGMGSMAWLLCDESLTDR